MVDGLKADRGGAVPDDPADEGDETCLPETEQPRRRPCPGSARRLGALGLAAADEHARRRCCCSCCSRWPRVPGSVFPQRRVDTGRVRDLPRPTTRPPGPWLDRLGVLRRLLLAVVLGDLPAAVRLARRAASCPRTRQHWRGGPRPPRARRGGWSGCPSSPRVPSAATRDDRCSRAARRALQAAALPDRGVRRRDQPRGRARVPRRDRQPGLPPGPARPARRPSGTGRSPATPGRRSSSRARRSSNTLSDVRHASAPAPGSTRGDLPPFSFTLDSTEGRVRGPVAVPVRRARAFDATVTVQDLARTPPRSHRLVQVNQPLRGRRHAGLPGRQRVRAGHHGPGRQRATSSSPARCRSCRRDAQLHLASS